MTSKLAIELKAPLGGYVKLELDSDLFHMVYRTFAMSLYANLMKCPTFGVSHRDPPKWSVGGMQCFTPLDRKRGGTQVS